MDPEVLNLGERAWAGSVRWLEKEGLRVWRGGGGGGRHEALRTLSVMSIIFFSRIMEHKPCRLLS